MRSSLLLLAGLAGSTLALPTASANADLDARTFGLVGGLIDAVKDLLHGASPVNILGGISAEAAAALGGSALGCKAGSIDLEYRKELALWLKSEAGLHLDVSLRTALLAWAEADASIDLDLDLDLRAQLSFFIPTCASIAAKGDLYVSLDGVFSLAADVLGVISATAQASLEAAIGLLVDIDWKVKAGLEFAAAGGIVADLDIEIINALKIWLHSDECSLAAGLKFTILAWIEGKIGGDVIELPKLPVGGVTAISIGKSIEVLVDTTGALVASAQAALGVFLETDLGLEIDVEIKALLVLIAKGGLAIDLDYDKRVELQLWLASSKCTLTAELKSLIVFWLSIGVSAGAEVSLNLSTNLLGELTGFITGTIDVLLGRQLHGLLSFLFSGKGVLSISIEARAQLAALIGGGLGFEIDVSIQKIIIGWLGGCHECCGGSPPTSSTTRSLPTSTPVSPTTTKTTTPVAPTSTPVVPTETETTPGVPTGVEPTETPSETPCDTLTTETPISSTIPVPGSETPVVPTGTETETTPAVPTGAEPTETPCETGTTETTISSTISVPGTDSPKPPTETGSDVPKPPTETTPGVPTGVEPTETPCDTLTTETTISSTVSVPGTDSPKPPTETTPGVPTGVEPTESSSITQPPVPTASSTGGKKTITITKTVSVEYCPSNY